FATQEISNIKNREGTSQRGTNNGGGQYGRLTKLEFPKFRREDVQGWLYRVHQFFKIDHIENDSHKIRLVSMHMFDKALNWHKQFVKRFRENVYQDLFEVLMNKVYLTGSYAISLFIGGLKDKIGHKCSGQVFSLEVIGTKVEEDMDLLLTGEGVVSTFHSTIDEPPLISLNALTGRNSYKTMRVKGYVGKNVEVNELVHKEIVEVLNNFEPVFEVPTGLPPKRSHDHTIPLIPNTPPISVRPYMHPPSQKMQQFNKQTVKDKFPIPVIEELINELSGTKVFSKLDLKSGYHQIKMKDADVLTVMKTHSLFAKLSKCTFATNSVEYLGHIISDKGVSTDISKALVLALPDFYKTFVEETDASGKGIGVVLQQDEHPIAYPKGMHKMVKQFIRERDVCQRQKPDLAAYPGYLQPLPIPNKIWSSISMDFIEGLPTSQGKTVNMVVVDRLTKCMTSENPKEWSQWLSLAEFWYNTNFHIAIQITSFEAVYGQKPPVHVPYVPGESVVESVDRTLQAREQTLSLIKFHLGSGHRFSSSFRDLETDYGLIMSVFSFGVNRKASRPGPVEVSQPRLLYGLCHKLAFRVFKHLVGKGMHCFLDRKCRGIDNNEEYGR
nr:hypothetical protein [Tanacetum cinerariifolium]